MLHVQFSYQKDVIIISMRCLWATPWLLRSITTFSMTNVWTANSRKGKPPFGHLNVRSFQLRHWHIKKLELANSPWKTICVLGPTRQCKSFQQPASSQINSINSHYLLFILNYVWGQKWTSQHDQLYSEMENAGHFFPFMTWTENWHVTLNQEKQRKLLIMNKFVPWKHKHTVQ